MANVRTGNSHFVDSEGVLSTAPCRIQYVVFTALDEDASVELRDSSGAEINLILKHSTAGESVQFDFSRVPLFCPRGLKVESITSAILTIVYN